MRDLSVLEQLVLSSIIALGNDAHSMAIRKKVREIANKKIMYGTLYNVMDQLLRKGYLTKSKGDLIPERRGRRRMYYKPTDHGKEALIKAHDLHKAIWANLQDLTGTQRK